MLWSLYLLCIIKILRWTIGWTIICGGFFDGGRQLLRLPFLAGRLGVTLSASSPLPHLPFLPSFSYFLFFVKNVHDVHDPGTLVAPFPLLPPFSPLIFMAARHRPSRSQEGYLSPSPPADMGEPFHHRQYYDNDAEPSETFHRDNYGSESSAAGLNDYDHPDPYGSSFT